MNHRTWSLSSDFFFFKYTKEARSSAWTQHPPSFFFFSSILQLGDQIKLNIRKNKIKRKTKKENKTASLLPDATYILCVLSGERERERNKTTTVFKIASENELLM